MILSFILAALVSTTPIVGSVDRSVGTLKGRNGMVLTLPDERTEQVIGWLLSEPSECSRAKTFVVQAGGANLRARSASAETTIDTLRGVRRIIEVLRCHWPQAKIVLRPIALDKMESESLRTRARRVNDEMRFCADGVRVIWCAEEAQLEPTLDSVLGKTPVALAGCGPFERPTARAYEPSVSGWFDYRVSPKRGEIEDKASKHYDVVFMGDSITHLWEERAVDVQREFLGRYEILNLGFSGDRTQNILWDCENGLLDGYRTDAVSIMIGTNNRRDSVEDVAKGIEAIVKSVRAHQPQAKVLLYNIFPRGQKPDDKDRAKVAAVNTLIRRLDDGKTVRYVELWDAFLEPDGSISSAVMSDYLHPTAEGYAIWARSILSELKK